MPAKVGNLVVEMSANVARLQQDFNKAQGAVGKAAQKFKNTFKAVGLSIAASLSVAALTRLVKESLDTADKMAKLSQSVGVSVEQLSSFAYAADISGTSMQSIARGLGLLSKNMMDAAGGIGEAKDSFRALGLEVKKSDGSLKNADEALAEIADRFAGMQDGAGKTALAMKIFGRSGAELVPLLNQGSAGIATLRAEAEKLGLVMSTEMAQAAEHVNDNFTRLKGGFKGLFLNLTSQMLPTLVNLTNILVDSASNTNKMKLAADSLSAGLKLLASGAVVVKAVFVELGTAIGGVAAAAATLTEGLDFKKILAQGLLNPASGISEMLQQIASHRGNLKRAQEILTDLGSDLAVDFKSDLALLQKIWDDTATNIEASAPEIGSKIAAPIVETEKKTKEVADKMAESIHNFWRSLGDEAASITASVRTPFEQARAQITRLQFLQEKGLINKETYGRAYKQIVQGYIDTQEQAKETTEQMSEFTKQAFSNMTDYAQQFFFDAMKGQFDSLGESFLDMINGITANWTASQLMTGLFGPEFGSGGQLGGILGSVAGAIAGTAFAGTGSTTASTTVGNTFALNPRASGGPVFPGKGYLVGEEGPELLLPNTPGTIIPNDQLTGGSKAQAQPSTTIVISAVDAKSFEDLCRRNPQAIVGRIEESLSLGNRSLKRSLRSGG